MLLSSDRGSNDSGSSSSDRCCWGRGGGLCSSSSNTAAEAATMTAGDKGELQPGVFITGRAINPRTLGLHRILATQDMAHALDASTLSSPKA